MRVLWIELGSPGLVESDFIQSYLDDPDRLLVMDWEGRGKRRERRKRNVLESLFETFGRCAISLMVFWAGEAAVRIKVLKTLEFKCPPQPIHTCNVLHA